MTLSPGRRHELASSLLAWYDRVRRDLPWRRTRDPYAIWVSEMMLQQTQVATVIGYYERWMARFPNVQALARASEDDVLGLWQGLGYYSRAKSLLRGARAVCEQHGGVVPRAVEQLRELPGIGPYSAGAIASIAHGVRAPLVDGNVVRVLCRSEALTGDPARAPLKQQIWRVADALVPSERPGDFNQALMELGATVCTPKAPRCNACPWRNQCRALERDLVSRLPELAPRPKATAVRMFSAVVTQRGRMLVTRLRDDAPRWAGMWQFPTAELSASESPEHGLARALEASVGIRAAPSGLLTVVRHGVTRYRITLDAYRCTPSPSSKPEARGCAELSWKRAAELDALALPAAHRRIADRLRELASAG